MLEKNEIGDRCEQSRSKHPVLLKAAKQAPRPANALLQSCTEGQEKVLIRACTFALHLCAYNRTNFWRVEIFFSIASIGRRPSYKSQREDARQNFSSLRPLFASCAWSLTTTRQYLKSIRVILEPRSTLNSLAKYPGWFLLAHES